MIRVRKLINRLREDGNPQLSISGLSGVTIAARNLERSREFYTTVFGFRIVKESGPEPRRSVMLAAPCEALLAIHESGDGSTRPVPLHRRWGFLVEDLDSVREAIWDLGVKVADDNGAPDHIHNRSNGRFLQVRDPDGNVIELVEQGRDRQPATRRARCPARRAWRRWVQPASCAAR
jgi:catechol 2,3-dioxygenase-like lactoylglutathione lyase family enzyme